MKPIRIGGDMERDGWVDNEESSDDGIQRWRVHCFVSIRTLWGL